MITDKHPVSHLSVIISIKLHRIFIPIVDKINSIYGHLYHSGVKLLILIDQINMYPLLILLILIINTYETISCLLVILCKGHKFAHYCFFILLEQ